MSSKIATTGLVACQFRNITIPGDATYQYGFTYDPNTGLLSQLLYPAAGSQAGLAVNYGYSNGVLSSVTDARTGTVYWQDNSPLSVNDLGESSQETLGNNITTETTFTPVTGWPTKIISGPAAGSASVQNQSFSYDALGNLTQRQDGNAGLTENFYYYPDNRLQYSTLDDGSTTTTNLQLSYNPNGGIAQKIETGGTDTPVPYNITQWTSYNYPKSISATVPSGNAETATFAYGPDRQRWRMVYTDGSARETTEYIGGGMEKVSSSAGTDYRYYIASAHGLAAIVSTLTGTHYVLEDQEGSVASLLTSTGSAAANESFTAYGNRREAATWSRPPSSPEDANMDSITRQGFTGQTVLGQMGLNHMNGRIEDAVSGTFLSPDPYVTDPGNTQDYYRYAYVYNNPLSNVDPSGFGTGPGYHPAPNPQNPAYCLDWYANLPTPGTSNSGTTETGAVTIFDTPLPSYTSCDFPEPDQTPFFDFGPGDAQQGPSQPPPQGPPIRLQNQQQGHDYRTRNLICKRPLTDQEKRDLISRFTVPNVYTEGIPKSQGIHLVANSWGIPGGWVDTTFSPNGLTGQNVTTPFHVFTGTVQRTISNTGSGAYMLTHGYGGYSQLPPPSPFASMETGDLTVDLGSLLDLVNQEAGPGIFDKVDQEAAAYAKAHYPGC